ncbi:MAG: hypothetical protein JNL73_24545 [Anaerolineales bacterium]|nr:hypothetical protein [Anaerolineales bacterium]
MTAIVITLHGLARWGAVLAGSWALAVLVPALWGRARFTDLERRALTLYTATVHGLAGLGVLIIALSYATGAPPFEGRTGTLIGHSLGGVLAALCVTGAVIAARRARTERGRALAALAAVAPAWLLVGQLAVAAALVVVGLLVGWVLRRAEDAQRPASIGE